MAKSYQGYALIIGVNQYGTYSRSVKKGASQRGLTGCINDARAWWDVARGVGIPAGNIRVLTSREIHPGELETGANGVAIGEATRQEILDGVTWLAKKAAGPRTSTALLIFAGHGDWIDGEGLVLCPSDVSGAGLSEAVRLSELRDLLDADAAGKGVLAFFDCSFGGPEARVAHGVGKARSLTARALPEALDRSLLRDVDQVVTAGPVDGVAYELPSRHGWHGPLSREAIAVLDHWEHEHRGGDAELVRLAVGEDHAVGLLELLAQAGLRDCSPCADKCAGGPGGAAGEEKDAEEEGDDSEFSGGILGFRTVTIYALPQGGGRVQVGQLNINTSVANVHTETWYLQTDGSFDNPLEFEITYDGKNPPSGLVGPNIISWTVNYDDSLWLPAGGKVIPAFNAAANQRTYVRNGSPITTTNKWFTLELPQPLKDGSITWWSAYASQAGLLFTDTSKVGDSIRFLEFKQSRPLNGNGRFLVETMA